MTRTVFVLGGLLFAVSPAFAQNGEPLSNKIAVGLRAATPVENSANHLATAPPVTWGSKHLSQADTGLGAVLGAANKQNSQLKAFGTLRGANGSVIYVPQPFKLIDLFSGGGAGYFHYSGDSGTGYSPNCYRCTFPGGWGDGSTTRSYRLGASRSLSVGSAVQYASPTNGLGALANNTDHWTNIALTFGFTF